MLPIGSHSRFSIALFSGFACLDDDRRNETASTEEDYGRSPKREEREKARCFRKEVFQYLGVQNAI